MGLALGYGLGLRNQLAFGGSGNLLDGPTNIVVTYITGGVRITWTDIPLNSGDVEIYRSLNGGSFQLLTTVSSGVQLYDDMITGDYQIRYRLRSLIAPLPYCAEYQAIYDQFVNKPTAQVAVNQNNMIKGIVDDGNWSTIAAGWIFAAHTNAGGEALINIKNPTGDKAITPVTPTFTAFEGFAGNGSSQYINLKWNPTDDVSVYVQNNASFIAAIRAKGTKGYSLGSVSTHYTLALFNSQTVLNSGYNTTGIYTSLNKYYVSAIRKSSSSVVNYVNKSLGTTESVTSTGINTVDFYALARNNSSNIPSDFSDSQLSFIAFGNFDETQKNQIIDRVDAYMISNGKGIL